MRSMGRQIASDAVLPQDGGFEGLIAAVVEFLNSKGYLARWEKNGNGYRLHVANCPYEQVALKHHEVCELDMAMLTHLLGTEPKRIAWPAGDAHHCTYTIAPDS